MSSEEDPQVNEKGEEGEEKKGEGEECGEGEGRGGCMGRRWRARK